MDHVGDSCHGARCGTQICPLCGAAFICGLTAGTLPCWCMELEPVMPVEDAAACWCPSCLRRKMEARSPIRPPESGDIRS